MRVRNSARLPSKRQGQGWRALLQESADAVDTRARSSHYSIATAQTSHATRVFSMVTDQIKNGIIAALICVCTCLAAEESSAAITFKRFPHCPQGLVSKATCECHRGSSGRFHYCHAGYYCDTEHGQCKK